MDESDFAHHGQTKARARPRLAWGTPEPFKHPCSVLREHTGTVVAHGQTGLVQEHSDLGL